jgi:hypothetical protein
MNLTLILIILKNSIIEVYIYRLIILFGSLFRILVKEKEISQNVILVYKICPNYIYIL